MDLKSLFPNLKYPILLAPMFLVSNDEMVKAAIDSGITAAIPSLNYRTKESLQEAIQEIKSYTDKAFGINLIVNKSNPSLQSHFNICLEEKVPFIISSLGNPKYVIEKAHEVGIKIICDVTNLEYAQKVEAYGADAIIAVNNIAGGHSGKLPKEELIPLLKANCKIPIISAGGIGSSEDLMEHLELGAIAVSVGSVFLASSEAPISREYKEAVVNYGAKDIVYTEQLSGTALSVINTAFVQEMSNKKNYLLILMKKHKFLKRYLKLILAYIGMRKVKKAAFEMTYQNVWCAGKSIEHVKSIRSISSIVKSLTRDLPL